MCMDIIKMKPDLVITEKGISGTPSPVHVAPAISSLS